MAQKATTKAEARQTWNLLKRHGYNVCKAAKEAGISRPTMQHRTMRAQEILGVQIPADVRNTGGQPAFEDSELRAVWAQYEAMGFNQNELARHLKVPRATVGARVERCRVQLGLKEPALKPLPGALEAQERQRYTDTIEHLRRDLRDAHRKLNEAEDFKASVFGLINQPVEPPAWTVEPRKASSGPGTPILFTSDFQWGERIRASELGGINEFNADVAARRYQLLIQKTVELSFEHMVNPRYDGLIYLRGGDQISGEIHADLRESNDLQSIPAVKDLVEKEAAGIDLLLSKFGRVHVIAVPGNHGRITLKPQSKGYIERNLDTLSAWWLESLWKREKRVTFQTPASGDAVFNVYGWRCVLTHGDRIGSRGGEGFIGAVATITRGMKKVADFYAALGMPIDLQFIGHFHTALELEYGFANGSLPGYSEYARDLRMRPQPPKQWLLFAHPHYGVTARWPVLLEPRMTVERPEKEHVFV